MSFMTNELNQLGRSDLTGGTSFDPSSQSMPMPSGNFFSYTESVGGEGMNLNFDGQVQTGQLDLETSPINHAYMCMGGGEYANYDFTAPNMFMFAIRDWDPQTNSYPLVSLAKVNQYMHDARNDFRTITSSTNQDDLDPDAVEFKGLLEKYGEKALETYHRLRYVPERERVLRKYLKANSKTVLEELERFYALAEQDLFCWLTKFGIMRRICYVGPVITDGPRGSTLPSQQYPARGGAYQEVLNIGLARWNRGVQIFGSATEITCGTKLYFKLTRKQIIRNGKLEYGAFQIVPGGNNRQEYPRQAEISYLDDSGRAMFGYIWKVGRVTVEADKDSPILQREAASNTGLYCLESRAYAEHGDLPTVKFITDGVYHMC